MVNISKNQWILTVALVVLVIELVSSEHDRYYLNSHKDTKVKHELVDSTWRMHQIDLHPPSGADGVKLADVNQDGVLDLVSGFEEGGVSRIYIHPGFSNTKNYWPYVELPSPDVEDALLIDLDGDGQLDLVTASEGQSNQIIFHWAPTASDEYLNADTWTSQVVPQTDGWGAWMFVVPADMDHQHGIDLLIGSKRKAGEKEEDKAIVGWLRSPEDPRNIHEWSFHPLTAAGWIMSIEARDVNGDQLPDIIISDRKSSTRNGLRWLENPGRNHPEFFKCWNSYSFGGKFDESMFHISADLDGDGKEEIVVPDLYRGLVILKQENADPVKPWFEKVIPSPSWAGSRGKAVTIGDLNMDGMLDLVLSFEEEGNVADIPFEQYKEQGKHSVVWATFQNDPMNGKWEFHKISGLKGRKFDLVNLVDVDGDGDLDVVTTDENEEGNGLGVVWYENPLR